MERDKCELCYEPFDPGEKAGIPPFLFCTECREKLRAQGLGPVQLLARPEVSDLIRSIIKREFRP